MAERDTPSRNTRGSSHVYDGPSFSLRFSQQQLPIAGESAKIAAERRSKKIHDPSRMHFITGVKTHVIVMKCEFDNDVFVNTGLVCFYAKCGFLEDAHQVFDDILEKNVVSWTAIMTGYIDFGKFKEAIELFKEAIEVEALQILLIFFFSFSLRYAYAQVTIFSSKYDTQRYNDAKKVFDEMSQRYIVASTVMISCYLDHGLVNKAMDEFRLVSTKDNVGWTAMIDGG
ncbi:pentatricopeptide repeat-containing protein ELI1, chloroplastic-like [Lycium barbarum]|uniref:pentatricopeptide repeat-containing protein ELI1, chloroplastic-like n=1 Tax=Lycium barbarum TaxID=112863 RepID=UPI00293F54D3|nr:pentatricopeptide repeat-containing protein ELI1, chloroplastic-like [Lycium barbarum]